MPTDKLQIDLELAVGDLRINLTDFCLVILAAPIDCRPLSDLDAAEIIFIDPGHQLVPARAVDLTDALAALKRLADLDRKAG